MTTPGDLAALEVDALAATGEWTALAALARHSSSPPTSALGGGPLNQLARHADHPDAFAWLWALTPVHPNPKAWAVFGQLPAGLVLPPGLVDAVIEEVTAGPGAVPSARITARADLLRALDPTDPGTVQVARAVLATDTAPREVGDQAVRLLGTSRDPQARADLLAAARAAATAEVPDALRRAQLVAALVPPLSPQEATALFDAAQGLREGYPLTPSWADSHQPTLWPILHRLLQHLPDEQFVQLCAGWATAPEVAERLFSGDGLIDQGPEKARALLEAAPSLDAALLDALLVALPRLGDPHTVDLFELAHRLLPEDQVAPARRAYFQATIAAELGVGTGSKHRAMVHALQRFALAAPRTHRVELADDPSLAAWVAVLRAGDLQQLSPVEVTGLTGQQRRRLGAALGQLLVRAQSEPDYSSDQVSDDGWALMADLDDGARAEVLAGLVTVAAPLLTERLLQVALDGGRASTTAVAAVNPVPIAATWAVAADRWPADRALDILAAAPAGSVTTRAVLHVADGMDWPALETAGVLGRAAETLTGHPYLLQRAVSAAINALTGPPARRPNPARVTVLVRALLSTPAAAAHLQDPSQLIGVLVDVRSPHLNDLAAEWLTCAPRIATVVALAVHADEASARTPSRYAGARRLLATDLCRTACDEDVPDTQRREDLQLAATADPARAHAAALAILAAPSSMTPLRRSAAAVLAATPLGTADETQLPQLLEEEDDAEVRRLLEDTRRRLTSGTTGEALANLLHFLGASTSFGVLDVDVCLPVTDAHPTFRQWVDAVRASARDTARNHVNTLVVLGDLLGEQALAAMWKHSGTTRNAGRATELLTHSGKEDIGALVRQQQALEELPWLSHLASLRDLRTAHPTPRGSHTPLLIDDDDLITARSLTRLITEGWVTTMYRLTGHRPPESLL